MDTRGGTCQPDQVMTAQVVREPPNDEMQRTRPGFAWSLAADLGVIRTSDVRSRRRGHGWMTTFTVDDSDLDEIIRRDLWNTLRYQGVFPGVALVTATVLVWVHP